MQNSFNLAEDHIDKCILYEITGYQADTDDTDFWNLHYDEEFENLGPVESWMEEQWKKSYNKLSSSVLSNSSSGNLQSTEDNLLLNNIVSENEIAFNNAKRDTENTN